MSVSKDCSSCFAWQKDSGIKYDWTPCLSSSGKPVCAPCNDGGSPGEPTPNECVQNLLNKYDPSQLPSCSRLCYPQCANCTSTGCTDPNNCSRETLETYQFNRVNPNNYTTLGHTWSVQKPYNL